MAFDPSSIAGALFSGLNALIKISQQTAQFKQVPHEVKQLQINVHLADDAISTAYRLQRDNPTRVLGDRLVADVQRSTQFTQEVLIQLRDSIEDCSKDLKTTTTVSVRNRMVWMLWKNKEFNGNLATLANALTALNRDIGRMEVAVRVSSPGLPSYEQVVKDEEAGATGFPRAPSRRRPLLRQAQTRQPDEGFTHAMSGLPEPHPGAVELEGNHALAELPGPDIAMPPLLHMSSAPDELPQTSPGRWPDHSSIQETDEGSDTLVDLRPWEEDDRHLRPSGRSTRRRSNFI